MINHAYNDTLKVLNKVHAHGYRRPGLVLGRYEDVRGGHANLSAYLGWCEQTLGTPVVMPVLHLERVEEKPLVGWLRRYRPDVIIVVLHHEVLADLIAIMHRQGIRGGPQDMGVAVLSQVLRGTDLSGLEENQRLMGEWAVELLVGRITNRDFGFPAHPRTEMVEGNWIRVIRSGRRPCEPGPDPAPLPAAPSGRRLTTIPLSSGGALARHGRDFSRTTHDQSPTTFRIFAATDRGRRPAGPRTSRFGRRLPGTAPAGRGR